MQAGNVSLERLREIMEEVASSGEWPAGASAIVEVDGEVRFEASEMEALLSEVDGDDAPWADLLPELDEDDERFYWWADRTYAAMALLSQAVTASEEAESEAGDLEVTDEVLCEGSLEVGGSLALSDSDAVLWVTGDLKVAGDLELADGASLMVLGDVEVGGNWSDYAEWNVSLILGGLTVRGAVISSGELLVGGRLTAPLVDVSYNHGRTVVLGGVTAWLLVESDHGESRFLGTHDVALVQIDESIGLEPTPIEDLLAGLREGLALPGLEDGEYDDLVDEYEEMDAIMEELRGRLEDGEPVLKGDGEGPLYA